LWTLGILAFLVALAEILLRSYAPTLSYQYAQLRATPELASLPAELIVQKVGFRSGNPLAIQCGLIGTGLMIIAAIYPLFRRLKAFRWLASNTMWVRLPPDGRHGRADVRGPALGAQAVVVGVPWRSGRW
jgi:hypothetical protein